MLECAQGLEKNQLRKSRPAFGQISSLRPSNTEIVASYDEDVATEERRKMAG